MSNGKQKESVIDCVMVFSGGGQPLFIRANSDRAKALFMQWGVSDEVAGIDPPAKPTDFTESIPDNWIVGVDTEEDPQAEYLVQEIALPQARLMLH